jgi:hypothetical protein
MRRELPASLEGGSPYPELAQELATAATQLEEIARRVLEPLEALRQEVQELDSRLEPVERRLQVADSACRGVEKLWLAIGEAQLEVAELRKPLAALEVQLEELQGDAVAAVLRILDDAARSEIANEMEDCASLLRAMKAALADAGVRLVFGSTEPSEVRHESSDEVTPEESPELVGVIRRLRKEVLEPTLRSVRILKDRNVLALKEKICQEMGSMRATFLQPSFAHIAAADPRSMKSPQHFFLKEFDQEAHRSKELLETITELWRYTSALQQAQVAGLQFGPQNLRRIAARVLLENDGVPGGEDWDELAEFLAEVKNQLVPRIRLACSLSAMRFRDKQQFTLLADRLAQSCSDLFSERELTRKIMEKIDAMDQEEEGEGEESSRCAKYRRVIIDVTRKEMARNLHVTCSALVELLPYVGTLLGGIQMRTSLSFSNDQEE